MKAIYLLLALFSFSFAKAQDVSLGDSTLFDFWVGDWDLIWTDANGKIEKGTNHITKILDGKVIQEHFSDNKNSLKGTSITVFNPRRKMWYQAWADNQGGYFDFEGNVADGKRMFSTRVKEVNGNKIIQRMVFYNIKENAFNWDWEMSKDGGTSWELQWRILYERKRKS